MSAFINLSAYKFFPLENLAGLRQRLLDFTRTRSLKGTILLSPEGINVFVAGRRDDIDALVVELRSIPGLTDLASKESGSSEQPFDRMLVKIKKEIIAFGVDGIDPARQSAAKLAPRTLKQWLDEGRAITLLDTRNDYEIRLGTFRGAVPAGIENFRDFPEAARRLRPELKAQPIVMFCTGGIRCEKAGALMHREGFSVFQLEGGILKYFEECGGAHYDGECFVFDQRVGVDPDLRETESVLCGTCQLPVSGEDQLDRRYVPDISCPHCFGREGRPTASAVRRDVPR